MNKAYPVERVRIQTRDILLAWAMSALLRGIASRVNTPFLLD